MALISLHLFGHFFPTIIFSVIFWKTLSFFMLHVSSCFGTTSISDLTIWNRSVMTDSLCERNNWPISRGSVGDVISYIVTFIKTLYRTKTSAQFLVSWLTDITALKTPRLCDYVATETQQHWWITSYLLVWGETSQMRLLCSLFDIL